MAEQSDLHVEQLIQVSKGGKTWYNSKICVIRPNVVSIITPTLKNHQLVLRKGDKIQVKFFRDDSSYFFTTRVTGEVTDKDNLCKLAYPGEINRVQQRMHVRLPVMLDVEYAQIDTELSGGKEPAFAKGISVDISGGGMKLSVRQWVKDNTQLILRFTLPLKNKPEPMELKARVIRCIKTDPQRDIYQLGLRFINIKNRQQDNIVRYVFEKTALQKRLL